MRLPRKKGEALIGTLRKTGATKKTGRSRQDRNNWTRERLDYAALEAAKVPIESITYVDRPAEGRQRAYKKDVRVSVLPWTTGLPDGEHHVRRRGYLDVRVYINGHSTGQGVLLHLDHFRRFVSAIYAAERQVNQWIEQGVIDEHPS